MPTKKKKRKIAIVTGTRAEYGLLYWVMKDIEADPALELQVVVTGAHLEQEFGFTWQVIESDGFHIAEKVPMLSASDTGAGMALALGRAISGLVGAFERLRPDIVVILGDRVEVLAAASAAMLMQIPVAHISGGEVTEGAVDEQIRHAVTKLSHIHFPHMEVYADRLRRMGEEDRRIVVTGEPGLDHIRRSRLLTRAQVKKATGMSFSGKVLLVTFHPVTLELENTDRYIRNLLDALAEIDAEIIFTYPNADAGGRVIIRRILAFAHGRDNCTVSKNLGTLLYLSVLKQIDCVVGNSSSGLFEAPSFELPAVNIGNRQKGRERAANVIDTGTTKGEIARGIKRALDPAFRRSLRGMKNPYGDGDSSRRIVRTLREIPLGKQMLKKRFAEKPPIDK